MNCYLYDGSFYGLLTVYYYLLKEKVVINGKNKIRICSKNSFKKDLFSCVENVKTDPEKAEDVYEFIKNKLSRCSLKRIYYCFLSEKKGIGNAIYKYIILGLKADRNIDGFYNNSIVSKVYKTSRKVGTERHRLLGLLRFKKIRGDIFYAKVEPDYNIVALLAPHFAARLADQKWMIHDLKRKTAAVYKEGEWFLTEIESELKVNNTYDEGFYQDLWKSFFKEIAVKERNNPALQKQFMPERYWKHLVEKREDT